MLQSDAIFVLSLTKNDIAEQKTISREISFLCHRAIAIEIINNTRGGIVIFSFSENERECGDWGANSSPGCRAKR